MARIKRGALVASMLMMAAIITSACFKPYSQAPSVTDTPIGSGSLFNTSLPQPTSMTDLQNLATGTALSIQGGSVATATPMVDTSAVAGASATITPTAMIAIPNSVEDIDAEWLRASVRPGDAPAFANLTSVTACRLGAKRFQGVKLLLALPKQRVDLISQFHGSPSIAGG